MHAEYRDGNYERAFALSDQVDDEHIEAVLKDGVLRLKLPKAAPFAREEDCGAVGVRRKV